MRRMTPFAIVLSVLAITACSFWNSSPSEDADSSSSSSASSDAGGLVTHNVSYTGRLETLDASIYQQGTHKLMITDDDFLLLESTDANLDLDAYVGKRVDVRGSVQPTVEAGGMLLRAEEITVIGEASSSVSASVGTMCGGIAALPCDAGQECVDDPTDSCDPDNGGADCGGICVAASSSSAMSESSSAPLLSSSSSSKVSSSVAVSSSRSSSVAAVTSSSSAPAVSAEMEQQVQLMAKQNYAEANLWTQSYCTSHVAFCIPVHKNWYFKSFGATTSNQWHVEFGMQAIDKLGQGAIVLNLVAGTSSSANAADGEIKTKGRDIVGYKDWNGAHFELIADARLREAVAYMIARITPYTPAQ